MRRAVSLLKTIPIFRSILTSSDAAELQAVLISSGLLPEVEEQMHSYGIGLAGQLAFNGNIRGSLELAECEWKSFRLAR